MDSTASWANETERSVRRTQTLVSSLGFSNLTNKTIRSLQDLLRTIQPLQLKLYESVDLPEESWLGHGASYNVWKCHNRSSATKEAVAIKKVKLPKGSDDFEAFQSRVACVLKDIVVMNHPPLIECNFILDLLGYGWNIREGSIPFLVTEYAPGRTLRQFLQEHQDTSGRQKMRFCRNVIDGLNELHLAGVIHGDLKLDNILVIGGIAKISDFGHSLLLTPADEDESPQSYRGTELYNPPEITNHEHVDWRTIDLRKCDMWALGLLCWEAMRGGIPFYQDRFVSNILSDKSPHQSRSSFGSFPEPSSASSHTSVLNNISKVQVELKSEATRYSRTGLKLLLPPFATEMLRRLFEATLESNPAARVSEVSSLPLTYGTFSECPTVRMELTETPEMVALWSFDPLIPSKSAAIPFNAKKQIFSDWQRLAMSNNYSGQSSASFHTGLACAIGFGTKIDSSAFEEWMARASGQGNIIAKHITELLDQHKIAKKVEPSPSSFTLFLRHLVQEMALPAHPLIKLTGAKLDNESSELELLDACKHGNYNSTCEVLDRFVTPVASHEIVASTISPLHWLFMFPEDQARVLIERIAPLYPNFLNCKSEPIQLDVSLPFTLMGTPLSFAIAAGSFPTVKLFLEKGAMPDQDSFALAARLHLDSILEELTLRLLWENAQDPKGPPTTIDGDVLYLELSTSTNLERSLIHGPRQHLALESTVKAIKKLSDALSKSPVVVSGVSNSHNYSSSSATKSSSGTQTQRQITGNYNKAIEKALVVAEFTVAHALLAPAAWIELDEANNNENLHSPPSKTSLMLAATHAASSNSLSATVGAELIAFGLAYGASLNEGYDKFLFRRPINLIIDAHREDLLLFLLDHGADVNLRDASGMTALMQLFRTGFVNKFRLELFLSKGAKPRIQDRSGNSALHIAAEQGLVEEIEILLDHNVDVNLKNYSQETALHRAVKFGQFAAMSILIRQPLVDLEARQHLRDSPLMIAICEGHAEAVELLIAYGVNMGICNPMRQSCLHIAVSHYQVACLNVILASIDQEFLQLRDLNGNTALSKAMEMRCHTADKRKSQCLKDICRALLDARSETTIAFHWAIETQDTSVFREFQKYDPDYFLICPERHGNISGKTPFGLAAHNGDIEMIKLLLATQNDPQLFSPTRATYGTSRDSLGRSCLHSAVLGLLSMSHQNTQLTERQVKAYMDVVELLLKSGVSCHATDIYGCTALHYAAIGANYPPTSLLVPWSPTVPLVIRNQVPGLVVILLEAGADPSLQNHQGFSSLRYAMANLNVEAVKDMMLRDTTISKDQSVLHFTLKASIAHPFRAHSFHPPSLSLCLDLLELGFDPFKTVENGNTAYNLVNELQDQSKRVFLRGCMLLRSGDTGRAFRSLKKDTSEFSTSMDDPELLSNRLFKELRELLMLPTIVEIPEMKLGADSGASQASLLEIWMYKVEITQKLDKGTFWKGETFIFSFGDILLQAGADILSIPTGRGYAIEEAIAAMPMDIKFSSRAKFFFIVRWLIREHIRGSQDNSFQHIKQSGGRFAPLNVATSASHRSALECGWRCAVKNNNPWVMEEYIKLGVPVDMSLLSLKSLESGILLQDHPAVRLLCEACGTRNTSLLAMFQIGDSVRSQREIVNFRNVEVQEAWAACTVFQCRIKVIFDGLSTQNFVRQCANSTFQLPIQTRIKIFQKTLPRSGSAQSSPRCAWMLDLISELDGQSTLDSPDISSFSPELIEEVKGLLDELRLEFNKKVPGSQQHLARTLLAKELSVHGHTLAAVYKNIDAGLKDAALRWAATTGHLNITDLFLKGGSSLETLDEMGRSVLHTTVHFGSLYVVRFLLCMGMNPGHSDNSGATAFHIAVKCGYKHILEALCEKISTVDYSRFMNSIQNSSSSSNLSEVMILPRKVSWNLLPKLGKEKRRFSSLAFWDSAHDGFLRAVTGKKNGLGLTAFMLALRAGTGPEADSVRSFLYEREKWFQAPLISES